MPYDTILFEISKLNPATKLQTRKVCMIIHSDMETRAETLKVSKKVYSCSKLFCAEHYFLSKGSGKVKGGGALSALIICPIIQIFQIILQNCFTIVNNSTFRFCQLSCY